MGGVDAYSLVKAFHIISATVLFGTGIGTAFFFWSSRNSDDDARLFAAQTTVRADFIFTLPAVILQPATGIVLMRPLFGFGRWHQRRRVGAKARRARSTLTVAHADRPIAGMQEESARSGSAV